MSFLSLYHVGYAQRPYIQFLNLFTAVLSLVFSGRRTIPPQLKHHSALSISHSLYGKQITLEKQNNNKKCVCRKILGENTQKSLHTTYLQLICWLISWETSFPVSIFYSFRLIFFSLLQIWLVWVSVYVDVYVKYVWKMCEFNENLISTNVREKMQRF